MGEHADNADIEIIPAPNPRWRGLGAGIISIKAKK
jgi:hypothetical protein